MKVRVVFAAAALSMVSSMSAGAQPTDPRAAAMVSTDPIRCWWRSDVGAVTIGQSFSVVLTCAIIDTDAVQVVPDESRLGVATVQVAPFEILGGSHPADARSGSRRFFQYQYTLRIIDPDVIGRDVNVPPLQIQYRVRSRVGGASTLEGRDLTYVMPVLPIKVLQLVPADVSDIRDGSEADFGVAERLRFRASLFRIAGAALAVVALLVGVWAITAWARPVRVTAADAPHRIPDRIVLGEVGARLGALKSEADRGWTDELVARALPLVRIVSSIALERPVSQQPSTRHAVDGRLPVSHGFVQPARMTIASSVTSHDVSRAIESQREGHHRHQLESLRDGLAVLTAAAYRESSARDQAQLDEALSAAIAATRHLAGERTLAREWWSGLRGRATERRSGS